MTWFMDDSTPPPASTSQTSLRQRTTHGVMWVVAQSVVGRGVMLVQQLALAWLLVKSDFGLIGLAYTVTGFVIPLANLGIDSVLVQRGRRYRQWATPAFWLGMTISVVAATVTAAFAAPLAAWAYHQPKLIGIIGVLALALPIQALQFVPKAQLQIELRFKSVVLLGILNSALTALLTIVAAWLGFGAYSFVLPVPIVSAIVGGASWWIARPPVRLAAKFARWRYLFGSGATVLGIVLLHGLINQGDYIALGLAGFPDTVIGTYVFAFNIAIQPLRLLSGGVPAVLFPSLSQLMLDPEKQVRAALRAMRLLTMVTVPFCLLQIVVAEPLFRLIFPPRWLDAVLPCQILTIGLTLNATSWPAHSLMMAQGRFRELFGITVLAALAFLAMLSGAIWLHPSILSVAIGVAIWHMFHSPTIHWAATRHRARRGSYLIEAGPPLVAGVVAMVPCMVLQKQFPPTIVGDMIAIVTSVVLFAAAYLLLVYLLVPETLQDLERQLAPFWDRLRGSKGTPVADAKSSDGTAT